MRRTVRFPLALSLVFGLACGGSSTDSGPEQGAGIDAATGGAIDAADEEEPTGLPGWTLEDIQPDSERFGQTYGLDVFDGQVIVAVLVEGF